MEELGNLIKHLCSNPYHDRSISQLYHSISSIKLTKENEPQLNEILPMLCELFKIKIVRRDSVYLALIAKGNFMCLDKLIAYEAQNYKLVLEDPTSLFDFCIKKRHWLFEVIFRYDTIDRQHLDDNIYSKIVMLKCIEVTNNIIDTDGIKKILSEINISELDEFWRFYVEDVIKLTDFVIFCKQIDNTVNETEVFNQLCTKSLLETLSMFINLNNSNYWEPISKMIEDENHSKQYRDEGEVFTGFIILSDVIKVIDLCKNEDITKAKYINSILDEIIENLLQVRNNRLLLEMLENIFVMLFLKPYHIKNTTNSEFICGEKEIRSILFLLKTAFDKIKIRNIYTKGTDDHARFLKLNKYLHDALWRLELITNVKHSEKVKNKIIYYMMAPPGSLIQMCLKQNDLERAFQVIEIFNLKNSDISQELQYTTLFREFREEFRKYFKLKELQNIPNNGDSAFDNITEKFIEKIPSYNNKANDQILEEYENYNNTLSHYRGKNEMFMNLMDILICHSISLEQSHVMLELVQKYQNLDDDVSSNYSRFYKKLISISDEVCHKNNLSVPTIILSPNIPLELANYEKDQEFYKNLGELYDQFNEQLLLQEPGILNSNHATHKTYLKIMQLCNRFIESNLEYNTKNIWKNVETSTKYLAKLYNYLKAFSKVLYIEQNTSEIVSQGKNTSYFELLNINRSGLMGKLLFERNLDPSEFEKYFGKMKLDYLYHVIGNCFPTINLHTEEYLTEDEMYPENSLYIPSKNIISYIQKCNWLLAFILNEMHNVEDAIDVSQSRIQTFLDYKRLPKIQYLKPIFDSNEIITALQNEINIEKIKKYVDKKILKHEELFVSQVSTTSNYSLETGEEIVEDTFKSTNWKELFDLLDVVPENQLKNDKELSDLKDMVLSNIVSDGFEIEFYKYVQYILNQDLRIDTILNNFKKWPASFCTRIIKSEISKFDGKNHKRFEELENWVQEVHLCEKLKTVLNLHSWNKCYEATVYNKIEVFEKLLQTKEVNLLIKFIERHGPGGASLLKIDEVFLLRAFENISEHDQLHSLLNSLPYEHSIHLCKMMLERLKNIKDIEFIVDYLSHNTNQINLMNVQVSLKILSQFTSTEQEQFLCLINDPLKILEVLIMNTKLDKLAEVLQFLTNELSHCDYDEDNLCIEKIDEMLRKYAEKSLDFRVITQPNPRLLRTPECKLMQSLDSLNWGSNKRIFTMPDEVPSKEEWVQNNEVLECLCCQQVTFSMFNRRHHCRRCGRVVCYACSTKRMLVSTYGDILVRVCLDCYEQTGGESMSSEKSESVSAKSMIYDFWMLTNDPEHNAIVREEFSYEHAPSVSLCLSILKYHSKTVEYPKFLLEQCDVMLKLLQPSQEPVQEIDYLLVIKMLKSLAIAAKMLSQECLLHYGTSLADRILSQADLLGLFAERGCLSLLPITSSNIQGPYIDASTLRRLRDKLLEREQWKLALEVSTKAGLDSTGVFAAWGKSCLKAGSLPLAREKFMRCLGKNAHYESIPENMSPGIAEDSFDTSNRNRYGSKMSNISGTSENRPIKNPPLLDEIIHILESKTTIIDKNIIAESQINKMSGSVLSLNQSIGTIGQTDSAISILNKLKNLSLIASGTYYFGSNQNNVASNRPIIDPTFYEECIYYLGRYGTHLSLLEFYIQNGEVEKALNYIVDNNMATDVFIEIYMRCLKDGVVNILQENMSKIDSTLDLWKDYLRQICRHLEKQGLLNSLYQLQQFMGDYIRAAMTCIRFYEENVTNFSDLSRKVHFLHKAEEHLKQVYEQDQWVEVASVRKMSTGSRDSFEEKSITNPSLVMKIDYKNIGKHVTTIWRQNEVANFLADCESAGLKPMDILGSILPLDDFDSKPDSLRVPTLFGSNVDKIRVAVLSIVTCSDIEYGFKISSRIIHDFKLRPATVFCQAGKQLAKHEKFEQIAQLVSCIKSISESDKVTSDMCDEILTLTVATLTKANASGTKVEDLIKLISDKATKISAYIEAKQLKTAYFFAVRYKRMSDIRRILREAELNNQPSIKALCQRVLQTHSHAPSPTQSRDY